ncbi:MAG: glycosyltransferase family 2 protein [Methylococcales bacterium]|nr:glycosyltransferase family 2 protein [Methylococcales bacterium]
MSANQKIMSTSQVSVIIPAYNEEKIITRCLKALQEQDFSGDLQIIVVCNHCQDKTAAKVSAFNTDIVCLETDIGSKTNALNLGDEVATFYPRIYLDADIVLSKNAIREMCLTLKDESHLATSSVAKMDLSHSSWGVKAFYDIWLNLPYCKEGMIGSGVYALSEQGRQQFEKFPLIIADDGYIRCLFTREQRPLSINCTAHVRAPKNLTSLIKIKTRSRLGGYELAEKFPQLLNNETKDYKKALMGILLNVSQWGKIALYVSINIIARCRANHQYKQSKQWERDESSRY